MATEPDRANEAPDPHEIFLRLWMRHEPSLRAFVRSCCPKAQEVDDVMREVNVAALRKLSTLDEHSAFGAWACLMVRYNLLSARRPLAGDRLVLAEDIVELQADERAEELPLRQRRLRALDECIEKLLGEPSGDPVQIDILFGEDGGNTTSGILLVEREGETCQETFWGQPKWSLFLTQSPSRDEINESTRLVRHLEDKTMGSFSIREGAVWNVAD